MLEHKEIPKGRKKPAANAVAQKKNSLKEAIGLVDNRAQNSKESTLKKSINNSSQPMQLYAFAKDGDNYDYGIDFRNHLTNETGEKLKAAAIRNSKKIGGNYWTTINMHSLQNGVFTILNNATKGYDFAIDIDGVEAISASDRHKTNEKISSVVVEGYNRTTGAGYPWYQITHLRGGM